VHHLCFTIVWTTTTPPTVDRDLVLSIQLECERVDIVEGGGSSWTVTRLHTVIDLTGYRTRDLLRIRRALYRLTEKI
jgi:hypothetical protein